MKKRIGNDITFTWHIYRKSGETQTPESFDGKDVEVKLISPLQRPVTIEDVSIATGVVTFTFRGKHQVTLGNYVAVLLENKGEDGMVTLDVVDAVTLVAHSYMEEDGDEGDVIEATSVELDSEIGQGIDAYTKAETDNLFLRKRVTQGGQYAERGLATSMVNTIDGVGVLSTNAYAGGILIGHNTNTLTLSPDAIIKSVAYGFPVSVVWADTATSQIPAATTEDNGLMSAADKSKLNDLPTATELTEELAGKQDTINDLAAIRSGAQAGATAVQPSALAPVATSGSYNSLSDKPDLSTFVTNSVDNLVNYYLKSETYTKTEVQQLIGAIQQFHYEVYATLPQTGASNVLYLIGPTGTGADKYEEYVYANDTFTKIGDTSIDLSGYVTTQALNTALADYVTSSALSVALAGKADKSEMSVVPGTGADADKTTITLKQGTSATVLTTHQDISGKENMMPITQATGATLSAVVGNYYSFDNVGTLAITLPTITGATKLQAITFLLACGSSALVTFAPQDSETILYQEDFALEADTTYEVTALWNGSEWTLSRVIYE